jgi:Uma2 family endonuclease
MSAANPLPAVMSVSEFLAWNPLGGDRWELVDGTPRAMAPSSPRHGAIQAEAARLLGNHLVESRPGCRVVTEPGIQPKVRGKANVRVPDLAITCASLEPGDQLLRDPLVVVEVLSPSNKADTWQNVWSYVTLPSVREILIIYTAEMRIDLLRRGGDDSWPDDPLTLGPGDIVTLASIGFTAPVASFYRTA